MTQTALPLKSAAEQSIGRLHALAEHRASQVQAEIAAMGAAARRSINHSVGQQVRRMRERHERIEQ